MGKNTTFKTFAFSFALFAALQANAKEFSYTENFDTPAVTETADLPEGWTAVASSQWSPIKRYTGSYLNIGGAHSGNSVLGTLASSSARNDWAFSKAISLKKGTEYTVSYWLKAPGGTTPVDAFMTTVELKVGTTQSADGMTTTLGKTTKRYADWEEVTYKFTPEQDGDYYFGFNITAMMYNAGALGIDDFQVTGDEAEDGGGTITPGGGEVDPGDDDKETVELPYSQSFDNENKDYDKTSYMPKGWLAVGTQPFVTAYEDYMPARDGVYYIMSPESKSPRDERAYTPFFHMEKGVLYNAEFYLYMPGDPDNEDAHSDFSFTVGTEQDADFHTTTLLSLPEFQNSKWQKFTVPFTPEKTGAYCFSFALGGEAINAGEVCIDLFTVKAPGQTAKPVANFAPDATYNTMSTSKILAVKDSPVRMINYSTDGETYEWTADGATPATSTEQEPSFSFPADGAYDITLKVTNAKGESTASRTINVTTIGEDGSSQFPAQEFSPNDSQISRDYLMKFDTDDEYDYITGFNHYYHKLAQKFSLPAGENMEYTLSTINFGCNWWQLSNVPTANEKQKAFSVVIYGDKNGRPDTENVLGRQDMTLEEAFPRLIGNSSFEMRNLLLKEPITFNATGNFYVSLEFSNDMVLDVEGSGLYRSFCAFGAYRSQSKETTFFVQPEAVPEGSLTKPDGKFYPVDVYDSDLKGIGLQLIAWLKAGPKGTTEIAVAPNGQTAFATRIDGNLLTVSGTKAGETVTVYDTTGKAVAKKTAENGATALTVDAPAGLYIVSTPAGTQKFVKK